MDEEACTAYALLAQRRRGAEDGTGEEMTRQWWRWRRFLLHGTGSVAIAACVHCGNVKHIDRGSTYVQCAHGDSHAWSSVSNMSPPMDTTFLLLDPAIIVMSLVIPRIRRSGPTDRDFMELSHGHMSLPHATVASFGPAQWFVVACEFPNGHNSSRGFKFIFLYFWRNDSRELCRTTVHTGRKTIRTEISMASQHTCHQRRRPTGTRQFQTLAVQLLEILTLRRS